MKSTIATARVRKHTRSLTLTCLAVLALFAGTALAQAGPGPDPVMQSRIRSQMMGARAAHGTASAASQRNLHAVLRDREWQHR